MNRKPTSGTLHVAAIVALVLLVSVPSLFTRDLWNPDEPRYMEVAREMVVLGEHVLPHLNGEVYREKPPLFFWLAGLLWRAGLGYNSGRIVTILATMGTLLLLYFALARHYGGRTALIACCAVLSTVLMIDFAKLGVLDPLLMFLVALAVVAGYRALHHEGRGAWRWWCGSYAAMGFGTLTKGPVGILVPGLVLLAYGLVNRKAVKAGGWAHLAGAALYVAVVAAWLVPACISGGEDYTRTILFKQNLGRAVRSYSHRKPPHYYILRFVPYFFPWSLITPLAAVAAVRQWRRTGEGFPLLAVSWLVVPIAFFSAVSGKRMNYVVPVMPAVGMLCAWYLTLAPEIKGSFLRAEKWLFCAAFGCVAVLAVLLMGMVLVGPVIVQKKYPDADFARQVASFLNPGRTVAALLMLAAVLAVSARKAFAPSAPSTRKAIALVAAVMLLSLAMDLFLVPAVNTFKSGREFSLAVVRHAAGGKTVYMWRSDYAGVYNLYTGYVRMPIIEDEGELMELLKRSDVLVISADKRIKEVLSPGQLREWLLLREVVGHRAMILMEGKEPSGNQGVPGSREAQP